MLGKTHIAAGIAASLILLQPATGTEIICAVSGGAIGGWISDTDCREIKWNTGTISGLIFTTLITAWILFLDYHGRNGICEYIAANFGMKMMIGIVLFVICCAYGALSSHRTFTHSFFALFLLTGLVSLLCFPLTASFFIGFASHLALDSMNKRGMQLFFPAKPRYCFRWCSSDGTANTVLLIGAVIISVIYGTWRLVPVIQGEDFAAQYNTQNAFFGLTAFQGYLIIINVMAFFVCLMDSWICANTELTKDGNFVHTILTALGLMGGAAGMLLSVFVLRQKLGKLNLNGQITAISLVIIWGMIYSMAMNPVPGNKGAAPKEVCFYVPVIVYAAIINLIAALIFLKDTDKVRRTWIHSDFGLLGLLLLGGAFGGLVVVALTGKKKNLLLGLLMMVVAQIVSAEYFILAGIA